MLLKYDNGVYLTRDNLGLQDLTFPWLIVTDANNGNMRHGNIVHLFSYLASNTSTVLQMPLVKLVSCADESFFSYGKASGCRQDITAEYPLIEFKTLVEFACNLRKFAVGAQVIAQVREKIDLIIARGEEAIFEFTMLVF